MERYNDRFGIRLAWIGAPLRKRLEETLMMPLPYEISVLLNNFSVAGEH